MFLAGEATHETLWGTVDGAWESGERAAEAALRKIGALREEPMRQRAGAKAAAPARRRAADRRERRPIDAHEQPKGADLVVERQGQRVRAA